MKQEILINEDLHGHMVAIDAGTHYNPDCDICISNTFDGEIAGGVIFQNYTGKSIAIHVASWLPRWVTKDLLWIVFDYPFNQLGVDVLFGQVPENNHEAIRFNTKLGFREIGRIADVYPDGGMVLMRMDKSDCRHIKMKPRTVNAIYRR